jgi:hypothetical protein
VAVVDAEWVTLRDSTVAPVAGLNVDIETDEALRDRPPHHGGATPSGRSGWDTVIANGGAGGFSQVGDVSVIDNLQTAAPQTANGCYAPPVWISSPGASAATTTGSAAIGSSRATPASSSGACQNVEVSSNSVSFTGDPEICGARGGVRLWDAHIVSITGKSFSGAHAVFQTPDGLSTDITSENNTLD